MSKTKPLIAVNFVEYIPYESIPNHIKTLGYISDADAQKLMDTFNTSDVAPDACIKTLSMELNDKVSYGKIPGFGVRYRSLDIDGLFYYDTTPQCADSARKQEWNDAKKLKCCARNLRTGKCRDEFIKNTLGAILFPQHYGKQK